MGQSKRKNFRRTNVSGYDRPEREVTMQTCPTCYGKGKEIIRGRVAGTVQKIITCSQCKGNKRVPIKEAKK